MDLRNMERMASVTRLIEEATRICGAPFLLTGEAESVFSDMKHYVMDLRGDWEFPQIKRFGYRLAKLRSMGLPVYYILDQLATMPYFEEEGVAHDAIMDLATEALKGDNSVSNQIKSFIFSEFGRFLEYDIRTKGITTTPEADQKGISAGNYTSIISLAVQEEFPHAPKHLLQPHFLKGLIQDSIRTFCAKETPLEEIQRYYQGYESQLPPLDALTELPSWLGGSADSEAWSQMYDRFLPLFKIYGLEDSPHEQELLLRSLLGMVERTVNPGATMQWALVLQGQGGCGKSCLGKIMSLKAAPYFQTSPSDLPKRSTLGNLAGASVLIVDEMDTAGSKHDIAFNKSFLTETNWFMRKAYREDPEVIRATWTTIFTLNPEHIPYDDGAQMRRYGIVRLKGGEPEGDLRSAYLLANREYLIALLYHLQQARYPICKPQHFDAINRRNSMDFVETSPEVATLLSYEKALSEALTLNKGELVALSTKDIFEWVSTDRFHPRKAAKITEALRDRGWEYKRISASKPYFWQPPNTGGLAIVNPLPMTKRQILATVANTKPEPLQPDEPLEITPEAPAEPLKLGQEFMPPNPSPRTQEADPGPSPADVLKRAILNYSPGHHFPDELSHVELLDLLEEVISANQGKQTW